MHIYVVGACVCACMWWELVCAHICGGSTCIYMYMVRACMCTCMWWEHVYAHVCGGSMCMFMYVVGGRDIAYFYCALTPT